MCDFHDFGLTFFSVFVLLKMSKNVFWVVARLPQRLKSTFLKNFLHSGSPSATLQSKFFQKTLSLAFEANRSHFVLPKWTFFRVLAHCAIREMLSSLKKSPQKCILCGQPDILACTKLDLYCIQQLHN